MYRMAFVERNKQESVGTSRSVANERIKKKHR